MLPSFRTGALLAASLCVGACSTPVDAPGSTLPGRCQVDAPLISAQKTDLLFVIDNSGSMAEEQAAIATELPAFLEALRREDGVAQDFRVGVITTSVYLHASVNGREQFSLYNDQAGRLQPVPDETGRASAERYLESTDPQLLEKFRRLVRQGTQGSGQETPFEAVRLAVSPPLASLAVEEGGNGGFLRDGARLLVVVVSDEDDCSSTERPAPVVLTTETARDLCTEQADRLTGVRSYYEGFRTLADGTGATREVLWATIGPVALADKRAESVLDGRFVRNADCPTSYGPGYRQREMAALFDSGLENLDSICRSSYRDTLVSIATLARFSQSIEVVNVADARLLRAQVTREDGQVQTCSVAGGDLTYVPAQEERAARLYFQSSCPRRPTDRKLEVKVLCAN
jgi:hypothetical protein